MIDHVKDKNGSYLYNLDQTDGLPEFVKQAELMGEGQAQLLGSNLFADSQNRIFPTHTKANTWLSSRYFEKFAKEQYTDESLREKTASRLRDMCSFWGLDYPEYQEEQKEASAAVRIEYRYDGTPQSVVEIHNADQMTKTAEFVVSSATDLPWEMRKEAARQLIDNKDVFEGAIDFELMQRLQKTAGYGLGDSSEALCAIKKRQIYLEKQHGSVTASQLNPLTALVKEASQAGLVDPVTLDKVAAALDAVDKVAGLGVKYGRDLHPPEESLFSFTVQDADLLDKEAVLLPSGHTVADTFLNKFPVRRFIGDLTGNRPEEGHAKEAAKQLTPRQSAKVYELVQQIQAG